MRMTRRVSSLMVLSAAALLTAFVCGDALSQGRVFSHSEAQERAEKLGLGTRTAATLLLNGGFPEEWVKVAGGSEEPGWLLWPIPDHRLGRGFGSDGGRHQAIDITAQKGTPVHAMAPGIVGYADNGVKGYGNLVMIIHSGGWVTLYAHLDKFKVEPGKRVRRNGVIGTVGNTGISRGDHLHFALIIRGEAVDPMKYLRGVPEQTREISKNDITRF